MDNIFLNRNVNVDGSYESSTESSDSDNDDSINQGNIFMNSITEKDYEKNRNKLFTKDIVKKRIVVDSHNYYQATGDFNTSNFDVLFDFVENSDNSSSSSLVTTNYDIYSNVIGFRLLKTTIRTPPYNINKTNNIIKYKTKSTGEKIHTITINPGQYEVGQLSLVFQLYSSRISRITTTNEKREGDDITEQYSQYVKYSDVDRVSNIGNGVTNDQSDSSSFTTTPHTLRLTFKSTDETALNLSSSESSRELKAMIFMIEYFGDPEYQENGVAVADEITFLWDYNNITRGAARVFGFLPKKTTSKNMILYSDRLLDVSSHFVDLVIPEIPSIACKRNSSGREIIERIQLKAGHGEYLHYGINVDESKTQHYFSPITLHRLNIQLYSVNNVLYDANNSDVSYEFEITMVKNKKLLT